MNAGGTRAACAPRPARTRRVPISAPVLPASPSLSMARTAKVHPFALVNWNKKQRAREERGVLLKRLDYTFSFSNEKLEERH